MTPEKEVSRVVQTQLACWDSYERRAINPARQTINGIVDAITEKVASGELDKLIDRPTAIHSEHKAELAEPLNEFKRNYGELIGSVSTVSCSATSPKALKTAAQEYLISAEGMRRGFIDSIGHRIAIACYRRREAKAEAPRSEGEFSTPSRF